MFPFHRVTITSFIKLWSIIICFILGISSCTIEKQYHSWGWKINTSNSISANKRSKENSSTNTAGALNHRNNTASKDNTTSNRNYSSVATQIKNKLPNSSANSIFDWTSSNLTAQKYSTVKFKNLTELNPTNWLSKPQDTVFFQKSPNIENTVSLIYLKSKMKMISTRPQHMLISRMSRLGIGLIVAIYPLKLPCTGCLLFLL